MISTIVTITSIRQLIIHFILFMVPFSDSSDSTNLNLKLDGDWEIYYFEFGGDDLKGKLISSSLFKFNHQTENCGDYVWTLHYKDGHRDTIAGLFHMDRELNEIKLLNGNQNELIFEYTLNPKELILSGNIEYGYGVIKSRR